MRAGALLVAVLAALCAGCATTRDDGGPWRPLFDGQTTTGWRGYRRPDFPAGWQIVDGALTRVGEAGDIITVEEFGDFELKADWKIAPKGNSGIMYRVAETRGAPYETGPEYQVLDDAGHGDGKNPLTSAGSIYAVYAPAKKVVKPAGEWNQTRIVAKGTKIEHWLNGEKVCEAVIGSEDWNACVAKSKWAKVPTYGKETKGKIDLQVHGDKVEYKNIKVLVLK